MRDESDNPTTQMSGQDDTFQSVNAMETLRGCFECTDWGVFKEAAVDIDEYTETVSDYITFCEGLCIPTKTITSYPNDKPWFTTYIKHN